MLWPLPRLLRDAAANRTTALESAWMYDWDWYATTHREATLFRRDVPLAIDAQYGIALFGFPLRAAGLPPLLVQNILILAGFAFTGYAGFVLARVVTGSWWAGIAAGILLAFTPWRFAHLGETQVTWAGWLPLMLAALIALGREPTVRRAAVLGLTLVLGGITSVPWMVVGTAAILAAALMLLVRSGRAVLLFVATLVVAASLLIPFFLPYRDQPPAPVDAAWPALPGIGAVLLALVGLIGPLGRDATPRMLLLVTAMLWIVIGCLGSLGAFPFVPFSSSPWAMVAFTGLALLAGIGAMKIARQHIILGAAVAALLLYELRPEPLQWQLIQTDVPPVYRWLARSGDRGAVFELPAGREQWHEYLFRSVIHHRPVVLDDELARAFAARPIDLRVFERLKARGVSTVLVHGATLREETAPTYYLLLRGFDAGIVRLAGRFDGGVEGDFAFAFGRGDLKPYFGPQPVSRPFGWLDEPAKDAELRGPVRVLGWALAPDGIGRVRVFVSNRSRVYEAQLFPRPDVAALFPWHDASHSGFTVDIHRGEHEGPTDVQVEITDARGRKALLPQRWFVWAK
jgi:hypothetical protein